MYYQYNAKDIARLWVKVDKNKSNNFYNGERCWEWIGAYYPGRYGAIIMNRKLCRAHRISYELAFGEVPDGTEVCHGCDNPPCVNPAHLFLGTHKDNMDDMNHKGRQATGESHGQHKLTDEQVAEIRRRYSFRGIGGESPIDLAKEFGISHKQLWRIANNRSWKK